MSISIEALADAAISELAAIKRGEYLDFNISILNNGLIGIDNITLTIIADDREVQTMGMGNIDIGYGRTLRVTNMELPLRNVEKVDFVLDISDDVRELDENNNFMQMIMESNKA